MKRVIIIVLAILCVGTIVVFSQNEYKIFDGVIRVANGVIHKTATHKDVLDYFNSPDSKDYKNVETLQDQPIDLTNGETAACNETKTFAFNFDGINANLVFKCTGTAENVKLLHNQDINAFVFPIPYSKDYLLQYNNSIYYIDMAGNEIKKLLDNNYKETNRSKLFDYVLEHDLPGLSWGERPILHQNGKVFAFITNRSGIEAKTGGCQVWIKNLETNEEKVVFDNGYEILGWDGADGLFIKVIDQLIRIDTKTCTHTVLKTKISLSAIVAYPYLINPTDHGIEISDLNTGKDLVISEAGINTPEAPFLGNSDYIVCLNRVEYNSFKTNLLVINTADMTHTIWNPPVNYRVDEFTLNENGNEVFINLIEIGNITNQKTAVVDLYLLFN